VLTQLVTAGSTIVLARLVPPAAFGEAAVPTALVAIAAVLTTQGPATPLVRMEDVAKRDLRTAVSMSVGLGAILMLLSLVLARPLGDPLFGPKIADLVRLASPVWLLTGVAAVPQAVLQRRLAFRSLSIVATISVAIGTGVSVLLAVAGLDASALVLGQVALAGAAAVLYLVYVRPPLPGWDRVSAATIASTGSAVSLSSLLFTAYRNVDYAILAARLPAAEVGIYWRAYQLGVDYQGKVSGVLQQLALPLYSRASGLKDMQRLREKITQVHAATVVPCLGFFVVVAPVAVPAVFGEQWAAVVEPARILTIAGVFSALLTGTGPLMVAAGRAWTLVWWNAGELAVYALLIMLVARHGIIAVAWAVAAYSIVKVIILQFLVRRHVGVPALQVWRDLRPAVVATAFSMGAAEAVDAILIDRMPALLVIAVACAVAAPVYLAALRMLFPAVGADLLLLLGQLVKLKPQRLLVGSPRTDAGVVAQTIAAEGSNSPVI
jgi:PST family polysaccharide transporter